MSSSKAKGKTTCTATLVLLPSQSSPSPLPSSSEVWLPPSTLMATFSTRPLAADALPTSSLRLMQKIIANYTHQQANVCDLGDKEVRLSDMINAPTWYEEKRERFVQGLQNAHDKAAVAFKTLIEAGIGEAESKSIFNFVLHAELENLAAEYGVKVAWPSSVTKTAHAANSGRPPASVSHRRAILDRVRANASA